MKSWFDEINVKDLVEGTWEVTKNGAQVASGPLPELDVAPRQEKDVHAGAAGDRRRSRASSTG